MKFLEEVRRKLRFRKGGLEKSKINSLKLRISDAEVEINKCNHLHVIGNKDCINGKYLICPDCGKSISTEIFRYDYNSAEVINNLNNCLRLYKLIITKYGTNEFNKAAKPYIGMIPYLDNINTFVNVMNDVISDIDVDIDDLLQNSIKSNSVTAVDNAVDEYDDKSNETDKLQNVKSDNILTTNNTIDEYDASYYTDKLQNNAKSDNKRYKNNTKVNKKQSTLLDKDNFDM